MKQLTDFVIGLSRHLDKLAGLCVIGTMLLVVANILLRTLFSRPILGSYEIVSYLTALAIGFALAHCAVQSGHIAVGIIVDRLSKSLQAVIDSAINLTALVFWGLCVWHLVEFAQTTAKSGLVSPTAQIPVAPVIYLVALGLASLSLVVFVRSLDSLARLRASIIPDFKFPGQSVALNKAEAIKAEMIKGEMINPAERAIQ